MYLRHFDCIHPLLSPSHSCLPPPSSQQVPFQLSCLVVIVSLGLLVEMQMESYLPEHRELSSGYTTEERAPAAINCP